jgi:hypothetical protein
MTPGTIVVLVDDEKLYTVGVVARLSDEHTARVCAWNPRKGRWGEPANFKIADLRRADPARPEVINALANIRRHNGVIPYGGAAMTSYIRVWPSGKEPEPE